MDFQSQNAGVIEWNDGTTGTDIDFWYPNYPQGPSDRTAILLEIQPQSQHPGLHGVWNYAPAWSGREKLFPLCQFEV